MIKEKVNKGDIVLSGGNKNLPRTQRRQNKYAEIGAHWIGMGVSGGYQAAGMVQVFHRPAMLKLWRW
jgi:6-phosphogluconate dehydrogenase